MGRKPSEMTADELEEAVQRLLVTAMAKAGKPVRRRWVRSAITDAICNAGPNWSPGKPTTDLLMNKRRMERERAALR